MTIFAIGSKGIVIYNQFIDWTGVAILGVFGFAVLACGLLLIFGGGQE